VKGRNFCCAVLALFEWASHRWTSILQGDGFLLEAWKPLAEQEALLLGEGGWDRGALVGDGPPKDARRCLLPKPVRAALKAPLLMEPATTAL
jgi:hypothetical protein